LGAVTEAASYTLLDTALGRCAIAWRGGEVVGFALPAGDDESTIERLRRLDPISAASPGPQIAAAIAAVQRLLTDGREDLRAVAVELPGASSFDRSVYAALREIGPGETITYGELAERAGSPGAARAVGVAMARNPIPVIIPCHRVLAGGGRSGGFSAPGGVSTKFRLLQIEQARRGEGDLLFADLPLAVAPSA
jgi:methylated-DNA-[protein]-cysteine S-methyltransferase